jgi:hypothetical protein
MARKLTKDQILRKLRRAKVGQVLLVEWHDAYGHSEWSDHDDTNKRLTEPYLVKSVGALAGWNPEQLILFANLSHLNEMHFGETGIPLGMIQTITILEPVL